MSQPRLRWQPLSMGLILGIVVVFHLLVPINPDHTLPAIPELVGIALLSGILSGSLSFGKTLQRRDWSFRRGEGIVLSLVWLSVVGVMGVRAVWSVFHTPNQAWIPCRIVPGIATKLECLLQASITQHYGLRTFFMLLTAAMMGTLAFLIARIVRRGWQLLFGAVVFGPVLVTGVGFLCIGWGIEQVLPKSLLHNAYGFERLTQIFGNPGWVWPYFAPGLAIALWATIAASTWASRLIGAGISTVLVLGVLATQQRGGLLLCMVYVTICLCYCLACGLKRRSLPILVLGGIVLAVLGNILYSLINHQERLQEIAQSIGYNWRANPVSLDTARLDIWKAGWEIFKEAPIWGHGYASWFQVISDYGSKHNMTYVLDTAHNLFMQMLVELGLLHSLLVLSILSWIAITVWQNYRLLPRAKLLLLLALSSFFIPSLVQEIDYIRPVFYLHALFWGTLAGLPFCPNYSQSNHLQLVHQSELSVCHERLSAGGTKVPTTNPDYVGTIQPNFDGEVGRGLEKKAQHQWRERRDQFWWQKEGLVSQTGFIFRGTFSGLAGICLFLIFFCTFTFSFGGFPFEANLTQPSSNLMRWLGSSVNLAAFATLEGKTYSVFTTHPVEKPISVDFRESDHQFRITVNEKAELGLPLANGNRYLPRKHKLSFSTAQPDGTRWISTQVFYPPVQSNLGIGWSRNMYDWETNSGRAGRWCDKNCTFLAKSCERRDRLDFTVQAPRPDYSQAQPLSFQISVYSLTDTSEFSAQVLQNLPQPLTTVEAQLETRDEEQHFQFNGTPQTVWYLVQIQAKSVFNPKSQGFSQDDRDLGLFVGEADCS
ncbi:MAG: O-antigen ligase family protein [Coleofasciculus sp. G3-WIS-01]